MPVAHNAHPIARRRRDAAQRSLALALATWFAAGCVHNGTTPSGTTLSPGNNAPDMSTAAPSPDPRVGLKSGLWDAGQTAWNMQLLSNSRPSEKFATDMNSDLAFTGNYAIQGNFNGFQIWDISNPRHPTLRTSYYCPASQSDVSVFKNLLIISGEGLNGRVDCGGEGIKDTASKDRLRGIRIFDISDLDHPKNVGNVQTCRGSHTHTLLVDPNDPDNVYVYISGSAGLRPSEELTGCVKSTPDQDPNSPLFRIEIIKIPVAHPEQAAIVSSAHIFNNLTAVKEHGQTAADVAEVAAARAKGAFVADVPGMGALELPEMMTKPLLDSIVKARGGTGNPTGADSTALRDAIPGMVAKYVGSQPKLANPGGYSLMRQCHDITLYAAVHLAGGACEGYGMLLDIHDPEHPVRLDAVSDSNFAYWHSATFNNDGTKLLFSDEWGGGTQPKCRKTDPLNWGADAIFSVVERRLVFQSYYKMAAPQTPQENCVAHNGSLIPIPGRDVMVQAWYQGGISVFDWTDAAHPKEIAYFDRGPIDSTRMKMGGEWSAYWYNGVIVGSEIARGLDILQLSPSGWLTQNEIDAARTVHLTELNVQGQPRFAWPATFVLARAYVDQLERSKCLSGDRITAVRQGLAKAEKAAGAQRQDALTQLGTQLDGDAGASCDAAKVRTLAGTVRDLSRASIADASR